MGFFDRLFGAPDPAPGSATPQPVAPRQLSDDELAVERYRYLLRTAPPETIEQVHAEAFAKLTPEQRALVLRALTDGAPVGERVISDDPAALARVATRQELRVPGSVERAFAQGGSLPGAASAAPAAYTGGAAAQGGVGAPVGPSFGRIFGASLLGSVAGAVVGTAIADAFLPHPSLFLGDGLGGIADPGQAFGGPFGGDQGGFDQGAGDVQAAGFDGGAGFGGFDDFGGGFGDFGGDIGI